MWVQCLIRALTENGSKPLTKTTWNLLLDSVGPVIEYVMSDGGIREVDLDVRIDPKSRILPTGPTTAVTWIGDVRGRRTVALDPWWDRGNSLLLDEASREALIGAAKATVAALARLATRDHALLRGGLPEVTRRGPTNVLPLARDSAVIECPLRVFDAEAPREIVRFPVPEHHTARELKWRLPVRRTLSMRCGRRRWWRPPRLTMPRMVSPRGWRGWSTPHCGTTPGSRAERPR